MDSTDSHGVAEDLIDPVTGEIVDTGDLDQLADAFERVRDIEKKLGASKAMIVAAMTAMVSSDVTTRTVRVRGQRRRVKIELPDDSWDQSRLREAYDNYPQFRAEFLQIAEFRVRLRELRKSAAESGPKEFEDFKSLLRKANLGTRGIPRVTIEE
jgi:hypothetical protein